MKWQRIIAIALEIIGIVVFVPSVFQIYSRHFEPAVAVGIILGLIIIALGVGVGMTGREDEETHYDHTPVELFQAVEDIDEDGDIE